MSDLTDLQSSQSVKIAGAGPSSGVEDNWMDVDSSGRITANQGAANATPWNQNISQYGGTSTTLGQKAMTASVPVTFASDQSALDVNIVGGAVDANLNSGQFIAYTNFINIGTAETAFYLFKNPVGSGKMATIYNLNLTVSGTGTFRVYSNPTITSNGTAITPRCLNFQTSPPASAMTPFSQPTISANGTFLSVVLVATQTGVIDAVPSGNIILQAGQNILVTVANGANNTPTSVGAVWSEI